MWFRSWEHTIGQSLNALRQYLLSHVWSLQLWRQYGFAPAILAFATVTPFGRLHLQISTSYFINHVSRVHFIKERRAWGYIPAQVWRIIEHGIVSAHSIAHAKLLVLIAWDLQHRGISGGPLINQSQESVSSETWEIYIRRVSLLLHGCHFLDNMLLIMLLQRTM